MILATRPEGDGKKAAYSFILFRLGKDTLPKHKA